VPLGCFYAVQFAAVFGISCFNISFHRVKIRFISVAVVDKRLAVVGCKTSHTESKPVGRGGRYARKIIGIAEHRIRNARLLLCAFDCRADIRSQLGGERGSFNKARFYGVRGRNILFPRKYGKRLAFFECSAECGSVKRVGSGRAFCRIAVSRNDKTVGASASVCSENSADIVCVACGVCDRPRIEAVLYNGRCRFMSADNAADGCGTADTTRVIAVPNFARAPMLPRNAADVTCCAADGTGINTALDNARAVNISDNAADGRAARYGRGVHAVFDFCAVEFAHDAADVRCALNRAANNEVFDGAALYDAEKSLFRTARNGQPRNVVIPAVKRAAERSGRCADRQPRAFKREVCVKSDCFSFKRVAAVYRVAESDELFDRRNGQITVLGIKRRRQKRQTHNYGYNSRKKSYFVRSHDFSSHFCFSFLRSRPLNKKRRIENAEQ